MISKADILQRIQELRQRESAALAEANALNGAIQDCEFWLARVEEGTPVVPSTVEVAA